MPAEFRIAEETDFLRFQSRLAPILGEASYCTLTDRSERDEEELLGRWPPEGDELCHHTLHQLWTWVSKEVLDLARERAAPCNCRVHVYGIKALKKLRCVTIRAEREQEDFDLVDDLEDDRDPRPQRSLAEGDASRGLDLCERASDLAISGARGIVALAIRLANDSMGVHERVGRVTEAQLATMNDMLTASRTQNGDFADALLGVRLEQVDEAEEAAKRERKKTGKKGATDGAPDIAREAFSMLGDLGKAIALKQDLPAGVLDLLGKPRLKALLSDPRLPKALANPDLESEVLANLEAMLEALPDETGPGPAATADAPGPEPDPEDFDV